MPTTQPLDEDSIGDIAGGPLKPIAAFTQPVTGQVAGGDTRQPANSTAVYTQPPSVPSRDTVSSSHNQTAPQPPRGSFKPTGLNTPGISLSGKKPGATGQPSSTTVSSTSKHSDNLNEPYTDADIMKAWNAFIQQFASEHVLVNAMRMATPVRVSDDVFRIAQSKVHLDYISENLSRITSFIHSQIRNSKVTFTLEEVSEESPLVWNERELVANMIKANPTLADFIRHLKLKL